MFGSEFSRIDFGLSDVQSHLDGPILEGSLRQTPVGAQHPGVVAAQPRLKQVPQLLVARFFNLQVAVGGRPARKRKGNGTRQSGHG